METRSYALLFAAIAVGSGHGQDLRSSTTDDLTLPGAWVDGSLPTSADIATWNPASTLDNISSDNQTFGGLSLAGASGPVGIVGGFNLVLDHSTDASTILDVGANDFTWGEVGLGGQLNIVGAAAAEEPGAGNTSLGATFAGSGIVTLASAGTKNWSTSGNTTSGANGVTNITFIGTLRLRGSVAEPETLNTNWLAFGGGGGTDEIPGGVVQTGAFHLDTGDEESRGDLVLTHGFTGQTLELLSLSGTGNIRSDWGLGAPLSHRGIRIDQDEDTVYAGGLYSHNGSGQRRDVTVTKEGTGTLTFIGRLGTSQGAGGNPSSLNFAINEGVWEMGNGIENPSPHLNGANWDPASTFAIASPATLRFRSNENEYVWDRPLSGDGVIEITGDSTLGTGRVALTGDHFDFTGETRVLGGGLRVGGDLGGSDVSIASDATLGAGNLDEPGLGIVKSLTLASGTRSTFRAGVIGDELIVADPDGLAVDGPHVITAISSGGLFPGESATIIDYSGTFANFASLSLAPGSRFTLVHNTANTSIDLQYTGGILTWTGDVNSDWHLDSTPNWELGGEPTNYLAGDEVRFDDSATTGEVTVVDTLMPAALIFENDTLDYTLSEGTIAGSGELTKLGSASATITSATGYTGSTFVEEGTLTFGDGEISGQVGSGPVSISEGTTLRIHLNDVLDYKADPRLRSVSGAGDFVLEGGALLFNYTGAGVGFAEAESWADFSGNLIVRDNSEFQTIRNGATAMGTGDVILGDATSNGTLSQIEGNWTWTNDIVLAGSDNWIVNRSAGTGRLMKLQGVISGSGGLTFDDAAGAMTNNQGGFILTGENTLDGTLTINPGAPVRVGGVPGETSIAEAGSDAAGSLGAATVVNNGILTFSRTDAHTVANALSGDGEVFIGLDSGSEEQVVTFTGTKDYAGSTTVRSGTLLLETQLPNSMVFVDPAGTLSGTGTLSSEASISGTLAPGSGIGILNSTSDVALESGSRFEWQIADWNGTAGTGYDSLNANFLAIGAAPETPATVVIRPVSLANFVEEAKTFTLATTTGGISGLDPGDVTVDASGFGGFGTWRVQANGNVLELSYTPGTGNPYSTWAASHGIAGAGADVDSDGDGVANGIEFVIGGDPSGSNSQPLLPTASVDGDHLIFVFRRTDDSAGFDPVVEYGSDLANWSTAQDGTNGVSVTEEDDAFGTGIDRVTVRVPRSLALDSKLFARLRVAIP